MTARAAVLLLLASAAAGGDAGGVIEKDTVWSGTVEIVEDVIVRHGATLTIEPGTRIIPARDVKGEGKGWDPRSLEIHVHGRIVAHGTPSRRIRFGPRPAPPADDAERPDPAALDPTWLGLVFHAGRTGTSRLIWCSVHDAQAGIQVVGRELVLEHTLLARCRVGLGVGILRGENGKARVDEGGDEAAPVLHSCLFARCAAGVVNERKGRPDLVRCVFLDCRRGVGFGSFADYYGPVTGVGTRLERCEFLRCGRAVASSARISNCIFERNEVAITSSHGHRRLAVVVDRYRIDGVLAHANNALFQGDLPPAENLELAAPRRLGALPPAKDYDAEALHGPLLEKALSLAEDSPGVGAAADGGDLGAFGRGRVKPTFSVAKTLQVKGVLLDSWLICGPPRAAGARDPDWPGREPRRGQRGNDFVWIGVADAVAEPRRPGGSLTAGSTAPRYVVAHVAADGARKLRLGLAFDGEAVAWCNGERVLPEAPLDFANERFVDLAVEKGKNRITLRIEPRYAGAPFRARLTDAHGDRPVGVACVSEQEKKLRFAVRSVKAKREENGMYTLTLRFTSPPHWADAADPTCYSLETLDGVPHKLRFVRAEFRPKRSVVVLHGARPPYRDAFRVVVAPIRDTAGVRRAPDCRSAKVTFR